MRGHRSLAYFLRPEEPNMFRYLRDAGYDVFWFGKNDALAAQSFYQSVTMWNYSDHQPVGQAPAAVSASPQTDYPRTFIRGAGGPPTKTIEYEYLTAAIRILERRETDRPFCIFLPLISPHPPYGAPEGFHNMFNPADIAGLRPRNLSNRPDYMKAIPRAYGIDKMSDDTFRNVRALYYGSVSYSDWLLGQLMEAIERTNHQKDTALRESVPGAVAMGC